MRKDNRTWYCTFASFNSVPLGCSCMMSYGIRKIVRSSCVCSGQFEIGWDVNRQLRCVWLVDSSLSFCCTTFVRKHGWKCAYCRIKRSGKRESLPSFVFPLLFVCSAHSSGSWSIRCWRMVFIRKTMKARQLLIYLVRFNCVTGFGFWLYRTTKQLDVCHIMVALLLP